MWDGRQLHGEWIFKNPDRSYSILFMCDTTLSSLHVLDIRGSQGIET